MPMSSQITGQITSKRKEQRQSYTKISCSQNSSDKQLCTAVVDKQEIATWCTYFISQTAL